MDELMEELGTSESISNPAEFAFKVMSGNKTVRLAGDAQVSGCFLTLKTLGSPSQL
jgi:hypothetical protein